MRKRKVALVMQELLFADGMFVYSGGDRYTRDMVHLCQELGFEPVVFQKSNAYEDGVDEKGRPYKRAQFQEAMWEGARVVMLPSKTPSDLNMDVAQNTQEFDAHVYFNMLLAYPRVHRRSVSISHGVWFDHVKMPPCADDKWATWRDHLQSCVAGVDRVVSVDTNTINFFGGLFAGRYHHKFVHIPNAVDTNLYKPGSRHKKSTVRVLYPRRWEILRGSTEMMRITEELSPKYPQAEWHFCGRCHSPGEEEAISGWAEKRANTAYYWRPFDEMPKVYQEADIAVIPTIGCEGTSYSLLESLSSGLPVVSTYVGGLSELVIDGYNGLKVAPVYAAIRDAVEWLIARPAERERMGNNARKVGEQFHIDKWKRRWAQVLEDLMR